MRCIYDRLLTRFEEKKPFALATIVQTEGSTPQVPGASAVFSSEGLLAGTLGGGLLEAEAQKKAQQALKQKSSALFEFHLEGDLSSEKSAVCGGQVRIVIDAFTESHQEAFQSLNRSLNERISGILATFIDCLSADEVSLTRYWIEKKSLVELPEILSSFKEVMEKVSLENKPHLVRFEKESLPPEMLERFLFFESVLPLPQLVIAGAGHIGQAVCHLGALLDFEVAVIDDRPEFANRERLPDADHILVGDIEEIIRDFSISPDTYVVIVTRGHRQDAEALRACISSDAAYIGMIGSVRKVGLMRKQFIKEGWATPSQFDRVYTPIGVPIHSKTVEEIAVSIAAQLVLVRSQAQTENKEAK